MNDTSISSVSLSPYTYLPTDKNIHNPACER